MADNDVNYNLESDDEDHLAAIRRHALDHAVKQIKAQEEAPMSEPTPSAPVPQALRHEDSGATGSMFKALQDEENRNNKR